MTKTYKGNRKTLAILDILAMCLSFSCAIGIRYVLLLSRLGSELILTSYALYFLYAAVIYVLAFIFINEPRIEQQSYSCSHNSREEGIKKCFQSFGEDYEDAIWYIYDHLDDYRKEFGLDEFKPLPGREPHLIDIQNCFCETDKYLRAKMPELLVGNVRIKQRYKETKQPIVYTFPPKWHINNIQSRCTQRRMQESIPF